MTLYGYDLWKTTDWEVERQEEEEKRNYELELRRREEWAASLYEEEKW